MNIRTIRFLTATLSVAALVPPAAAHEAPPRWHEHENEMAVQVPAEFGQPVAALALWSALGGGEPAPALQLTLTRPNPQDAELGLLSSQVGQAGDHKSILDFERYELDGKIRFALIFDSVEAAEKLTPDAAKLETTPDGKGGSWHLADFETFVDPAATVKRRWAALYRAGAKSQSLELGLGGAALAERIHTAKATDRYSHLADFEVLRTLEGNIRYAALFDGEAVEQRFFPSLGDQEFHSGVHSQNEQGFRLKDAEVWVTPQGETRFAALFEKGTKEDHLWILSCNTDDIVPCTGGGSFAETAGELNQKHDLLKASQPSLELVDLEFPLHQILAAPVLDIKAALPKAQPKKTRKSPAGGVIVSGPPTGTHAGLLHDAGTNGPP